MTDSDMYRAPWPEYRLTAIQQDVREWCRRVHRDA